MGDIGGGVWRRRRRRRRAQAAAAVGARKIPIIFHKTSVSGHW